MWIHSAITLLEIKYIFNDTIEKMYQRIKGILKQ